MSAEPRPSYEGFYLRGLDVGRAQAIEDRNRWIRLFNRLEAAVSRHIKAKEWTDDADDALHAAHERVLREASAA